MPRQKKSLNLLFIADPLENFDPIAETTLALMREAARRHYGVFATQPQYLNARGTHLEARVHELKMLASQQKNAWYQLRSTSKRALSDFDAILLRKDPPFDAEYLHHLYLLQMLTTQVYMMNHPQGVLLANEKILPLLFSRWTPETLVSANREDLLQFIRSQKRGTILKPIGEAGGRGVFFLRPPYDNTHVILESLTQNFKRHIIAQAYLPQAKKGDKRILLLGQKILGAFQRLPAKGEHRANLHAGGLAQKTTVSSAEEKLIAELAPHLATLGLDFVGLDLIGNQLIEVNATSPMGLHELNQTAQRHSEREVLDFLEERVKSFQAIRT